jgi:tRNA (cytidine/uridine-2'-O-)-methyltransferase
MQKLFLSIPSKRLFLYNISCRKTMLHLNVVLFEPEIPQNTGNIVRTCGAVGAKLHLIKPLGFSVRDRHLKRAGLDYWHLVEIIYYKNMEEFLRKHQDKNLNFITKKAEKTYDTINFSDEVFLVFGKETAGLPEKIINNNREQCFRIPMKEETRSLNLSNAVAIIVYEACRQNGFQELKLRGSKEFA